MDMLMAPAGNSLAYLHADTGLAVVLFCTVILGLFFKVDLTYREVDKLVDNILAQPAHTIEVWVSGRAMSENGVGEVEYKLFSKGSGEFEPWKELLDNLPSIKYACRRLADAGRPVNGVPQAWLSLA